MTEHSYFQWLGSLLRTGAGALAAAALAAACSGGADRAPIPDDTPVLRRGNGGEPGTLDPARAVDIHAFSVLGDLYEGLVSHAPDGRLIAGAAETWRSNADLTRFEFRLRDDVRWSNGDPVTSDDFVRAIRRAVDPDTNAPYASLFEGLTGYAQVRSGNAPATALGIDAPDPRTVVFDLDRPGHTLLHALAMPVAAPLHRAMAGRAAFDEPDAVLSNGPYRLVSRSINDRIRLAANPHHRDVGALGYCAIEYFPVVEPTTELTMYRADELDITQSIPAPQLGTLRRQMPGAVRIAPMLGVYFIAFDVGDSAIASREMRVALSMAIDRDALTTLLGRGELPAYGLLPPGLIAGGDRYAWSSLSADARRARALETWRGALGDAAPPRIRLVYDAGDIHERVALAVSAMWRDVLGVETDLDKREWRYFLETRDRRAEWDAMRYAWFADFADPANFLQIFRSGSEHNLPGLADARYDAMLDAAADATASDDRVAQLAEAAGYLREQYAFAPLYFYVSKHLVRPGIDGFVDNPLDRHPSRYLRPASSETGAARCGRAAE